MQKMTAFPFTSKMTFDETGWPQLDRGVTSEVLRKVLKNYYTDGVFGIADPTCLQVTAAPDGSATVLVSPGTCLIEGATGYIEDTTSLELPAGDSSFPRIDTIVARLNDNTDFRAIYLDIIIGTPASSPAAPVLARSDSIWEIGLANLYRPANSTVITNSSIIDTRIDSDRCGYVTAIDRLDTVSLMRQLNAFYAEFVRKSDASYESFLAWAEEKKTKITDWQEKEEGDLETWEEEFKNKWKSWLLGETKGWQEEIIDWFNNLREQLTENAAVSLQEQIGNLHKLETENKDNLVSAINDLCLSYDETVEVLVGVETVTVTLSAEDGSDVTGQSVILYDSTTGRETSVEYSGAVVFKVLSDHSYYITATENGDYLTPRSATYTAVKGNKRAEQLVYEVAKDLNNLTWEQIASYAESGKAEQMFEIGDTKDFTLTTGEKLKAVILDFDHDPLASDESKMAGITFGTKDCLATKYPMNSSDTNVGGYDGSEMFTTVSTQFYDKLPDDMKPYVKKVRKKASAGNASSTIKAFDVYAFLPAEIEVFGTTSNSFPGEGTLYQYFATEANRKKELGANESWALRSPVYDSTRSFCVVANKTDGAVLLLGLIANSERRFSPNFCM